MQAQVELLERYSRGVMFIIRRELGGASVADDLTQGTFRIALEKFDVETCASRRKFPASWAALPVI